MRIKDFKVGQTVFVEQIENAKRRKGGKEIIEEWEITKVGKKYIYAMGTEGALPGNACKPKRKEERLFSKAVKKGDAEQCNKYEKDNRWIPCSERLPEDLQEHNLVEDILQHNRYEWETDEDKWNEFFENVFENFSQDDGIGSNGYDVISEYVDDAWEFVSDNAIGRRETEILDLYMLAFKLAQEQLKEGV